MIINFNNNLCEFIDVFRKLIMSNKHVIHYYVKSKNQNKRVFLKHVIHFLTFLTFFKISIFSRVFMRNRISSNLN